MRDWGTGGRGRSRSESRYDGDHHPDEYYGDKYYGDEYYGDTYGRDGYYGAGERGRSYPSGPASLPVRAWRALSGVVCGAILVLTVVVCAGHYLAGERGFPGPGSASVIAHLLGLTVAVVAQVAADRKRGATVLLGGLVVIFTASILLWTQWWG